MALGEEVDLLADDQQAQYFSQQRPKVVQNLPIPEINWQPKFMGLNVRV